MWGRKVRFLKLGAREIPAGGVLFGDGSNFRFGFDVCVYIANDDGGLVLGGREIQVVDFKGADVIQFQIPSSIGAFRASIESRHELLEPFGPDLHKESTAVVGLDVLDVFLQIYYLRFSFQTDAELAERWAFSLQSHRTELEAAFLASDLGLDRLGMLADLASLGDSLLLDGVRGRAQSWGYGLTGGVTIRTGCFARGAGF